MHKELRVLILIFQHSEATLFAFCSTNTKKQTPRLIIKNNHYETFDLEVEVKRVISHKPFDLGSLIQCLLEHATQRIRANGKREKKNIGILGGLESPGKITHQRPKQTLE